MDNVSWREKFYQEELKNTGKGHSLRHVAIITAIIDAQVFMLASVFLESKGVNFEPKKRGQYAASMNIIESNKLLKKSEISQLQKFRGFRNFILHDSFKDETGRIAMDIAIEEATSLGREITSSLDRELLAFKTNPVHSGKAVP